MAQAVWRNPRVGFDQGCPIRVAIEVLPVVWSQVLKSGALTILVGSFTKRCLHSGELYKQWFATFGVQQSQGIPTGQDGFQHSSLANFSIRFHYGLIAF